MKHLATVIRAIVILGFLVGMQILIRNLEIIRSQTYQTLPYLVIVPLVAILFGALLRCDVFLRKNKVFHVDWLSLLLIGLPCLLLALSQLIIFTVLAYLPLPSFFSVFLGEQFRLLAGVAFGYTVVNSLFVIKES